MTAPRRSIGLAAAVSMSLLVGIVGVFGGAASAPAAGATANT